MLAGPLYMLQVYDRVLTSKSFETLVALSILLLGVFVISGLLDLIRLRILNRLGARFEAIAGSPVFDATINKKIANSGSNPDRGIDDLNHFRDFLSGTTLIAFFDAPWVPIYLAVLYVMHPFLGLLGSVGALILLVMALVNDRLSRSSVTNASDGRKVANNIFDVCERNAETLRSMGMINDMRHRWARAQVSANLFKTWATDKISTFIVISRTFRLFLQSAMLGLGAALAISGEASPGVMIAATIILGRALAPVDQVISQWRVSSAAIGSYLSLKGVVERHSETQRSLSYQEPCESLKVAIQQAGAPAARTATLGGINFELKAGEVAAIIGPSGSGKTTLVRMLTGIWHPQRGEVLLDGISLRFWNSEQLGAQIGYLPQDVELFDGTIMENIARFAAVPENDLVFHAAKIAGVHEMILQLPEGYETVVGAQGTFLSGGETQRIGLARAIYGNPFVVVLDEPNSNLDATGDSALRHAIQKMKEQGSIVIVVTHRPSSLSTVDKLLVLDGGRQRAFGPKEQVLRSTTKSLGNNRSQKTVTQLPKKAN